MRRLKPADDPLKTLAGPIEDEFDRVHMLGGSPGGRAAATDKFGELCTQCGVQVLDKSYGDAPAFAWCQAQSHIRADDELHAAADHFTIAAGMGRPVVPPGRRVAAFPGRWRSVNGARRSTTRRVGCVLRGRLRHGVLLAQVHSPSQQRDFCPDGSKSAVTDGFLTLGCRRRGRPRRPRTPTRRMRPGSAPRFVRGGSAMDVAGEAGATHPVSAAHLSAVELAQEPVSEQVVATAGRGALQREAAGRR